MPMVQTPGLGLRRSEVKASTGTCAARATGGNGRRVRGR